MLYETLKLSIRTIRRNVLRSILTVLGVVIGVAAVIVMVTLGQGTSAQVTSDVAKLGSNILMVRAGQAGFGPASATADSRNFDIKDVEAVENEVAGVAVAAPMVSRNLTAISGNINHAQQVIGTDNRYFVARDWDVSSGRTFTDGEIQAGSASCILGATTSQALFQGSDPVGETIRLRSIACKVIGVLASKGNSGFGQDQDDLIVMPLKAVQRRIVGHPDIQLMYVSVDSAYKTSDVQAGIEDLLRERRQVGPDDRDNFSVQDMAQIASMLTSISGVLTGLLSAVAGVSLLVGGIGIMNIMLVSVTERTREIGIRLAIGAQARQVLLQFLVEAVVLSLFGGVLGIALGLGLAAIGGRFLSVPFILNPTIVAIAFVFSALVGVAFGYFPARRAARLDPIEALRHE
ncbi:MAG TPA: ABC transporter permease [Bauldia sp.]|nr:ABC transporter permease [Bauldia sp.]